MKMYEEMTIEREHSKYPRGLKHYSKESLFENSLFDFELISYKLRNIWKGDFYGKGDNAWGQEESPRTPKEVLRRFVFGILHEDRDSADRERENRGIEERYIEIAEREQESSEQSNQRSLEEQRLKEKGY